MEDKVVHKELSYLLTGLCFNTHKELGRFRNEKQYGDYFEKLLVDNNIKYVRECPIEENGHVRCKCDFAIEDLIIIEFKAKSFITNEDYYQVKRYLTSLNLQLGILVNFRAYRLAPKRILNKEFLTNLKHSNKFEDSN